MVGAFGIFIVDSNGNEMYTNLSTTRRFTNSNVNRIIIVFIIIFFLNFLMYILYKKVYKSRKNRQRCEQMLNAYFQQLSATIDDDATAPHVCFF